MKSKVTAQIKRINQLLKETQEQYNKENNNDYNDSAKINPEIELYKYRNDGLLQSSRKRNRYGRN